MGVVLRCAPERKCLHPEIPAPGWQDLLNGSVKPAEQKRGRHSGEGNGWKPKRDRMLLKENGTTRKQEWGGTRTAEPWEQAAISQGGPVGSSAEPDAYLGSKSRRLWGLQGKPEEKRRI